LLSIIIQEYRYRKTAAFSLIFTIFIEVTQLVTYRGLFEFDDIIHNFLGACIGMLIYIVCMERQRKYAKRMTLFIIAYTAIYLAVLLGMYWCV
jgi:glycopeptide antibiotics resistance protein